MRVIAAPPVPFDAPPGSPLILRDGTVAIIRAAAPGDRHRLRTFFRDQSPESRYRRFFMAGEPSDEVVGRLCAAMDVNESVTLLAVRFNGDVEQMLGMASYLRVSATVAEVAFAVDDHFGRLGIATGLLERLAALASDAGFERFQATTLVDNPSMLQVFRDSGFMIRSKLAGSSVEVELALTPSARSVDAWQEREHLAAVASIRPLLQPASVAVVGVSRQPASLGRRIFDAMLAAGYRGPLYAVNQHAKEIAGHLAYRSVRELPRVDLAVLAVPRDAVLATIDDCAAAGVKSLVVITAGFAEVGDEGRTLQDAMLAKVRGYGMRMLGPNCMGLLNTGIGMNASFSPVFPPRGRVAFSSQSGALGLAILSLAAERGVGLSNFVSVGNKADVSSNDLLQYWEDDPSTGVILLYLESFGNPRRFARLARRIGMKKPIVAVKAGRTHAGHRAAGSHTAALAASEVAVDALFHQAGVVRADTIDDMFDVAACLDTQPLPKGRRVAIVTNAGGPGILAVDACEGAGLTLPEFSSATRSRLAEFLPTAASLGNPVDMVAAAGPDEFRRTIETVLTSDEVDALLVIYTAVDTTGSAVILDGIREGISAGRRAGATGKPVLACLMAGSSHLRPLEIDGERVPVYAFPENAVRALGKVSSYADWRSQPAGLFWSFNDIRADEARALCREVVARRGEDWLTPEEFQRVASAFGLPLVPGVLSRTAEDAIAVATVVGFPVAAKLSAPRLLHKSDVDGVRLNLATPPAVRKAFNELTAGARHRGIDEMEGITIQPMVADGTETIVGLVEDPLFGPLIGAGLGGIHVEALGGVQFRVGPLTDRDADELLRSMRGFALLNGARGRPRADVAALADVVLRVSRLAEDVPEILELDLNPVIVLSEGSGCRIVDARMKVGHRSRTYTPAPPGGNLQSTIRNREFGIGSLNS